MLIRNLRLLAAVVLLLGGCVPRQAAPAPATATAARARAASRTITFPAPLPTSVHTVEVWPLSYRAPIFGRSGVSRPNRIEVRRAGACSPVSIGEQYSAGAMAMLRASIWFSAVTAARLLGRPITDYCLRVDMTGHVDGPSAGALMTAGMVAAMLGVPVRKDATLTGTVNIGGAVGPVGGYKAKLGAAATVGCKRVGIPAAIAPKQMKPLVSLAKIRDLDLIPLETVEDAYQLLTGRSLPAATALPKTEMVMPPAVAKMAGEQARSLVSGAKKMLAKSSPNNSHIPPLLRTELEGLRARAGRQLSMTRDLLKGDFPVAALFTVIEGYSQAMALSGAAAMVAGTSRAQLPARLLAAAKAVPVQQVAKRAGANLIMTGGSIYRRSSELALAVEMMNSVNHAGRLLHGKPDEKKLKAAFRELIRAEVAGAKSLAQRRFQDVIGDGFMVHRENLAQTAQTLAVEAEARLAYARSLIRSNKGNWWDVQSLHRAARNMGFSESYAREYQASWPHIILLGTARASLLGSGLALDGAREAKVDTSGRSVAQWDRLLRVHAALVKRHTGFVPLSALADYRIAQAALKLKQYDAARLSLDAAVTECLIWLWLHGGEARKDPIDQVSKPVPYVAPVEEW